MSKANDVYLRERAAMMANIDAYQDVQEQRKQVINLEVDNTQVKQHISGHLVELDLHNKEAGVFTDAYSESYRRLFAYWIEHGDNPIPDSIWTDQDE